MINKKAHYALQAARCVACAAIVSVVLPIGTVYANSLTLDAAIALATERDLEIAKSRDQESMLRDTARVSAALPPPTLTLSAMNFPVDTFAIDQEPMTQLQARVSQMFPPGDSRKWRAASNERSAEASVIQRALRSAMLHQQLRTAWADGWMAQASLDSLEANRAVFEQALATTRASYSAGIRQARQREVLGAQASLTRLIERIERYSMLLDTTREQFAEWLTPDEVEQLNFEGDVDQPAILSSQRFDPARHPAIVLAEAKRYSAEAEQRLARELNKGSRGISLSYGYREDPSNAVERADFVSLGFTMDLASLRSSANSARRSAAISKVAQAQKEAELQHARLTRDYRLLQAKLIRLNARRSLYRDELLPQYRQQADATRRAFASDEARFIELQLVLIDLLNAELEALTVDAELMKSSATLDYLLTSTAIPGEQE